MLWNIKTNTMALPANFKWLETVGTLPKMITEGLKLLGIREVPGAASNPEILKFASELGLQGIYKNDDTSWCAVAHCSVAKRAGKQVRFIDPYDYLRAKAFSKLLQTNPDDWELIERIDAKLGDTLIFTRPGGGHIGLDIGESKTHFYVMGGNQNNMYSFTRVAKERLWAVMRPKYKIGMPASVKKYILNDTGVPVTSNES